MQRITELTFLLDGNSQTYSNCKITIEGYRYCDFDQMQDYSLLIENDKPYLIGDCYPETDWTENDSRIQTLKIDIIKEIDLSTFTEEYTNAGQPVTSHLCKPG